MATNEMICENPCAERLELFTKQMRRKGVSVALLFGEANIRSLINVVCDNGCLIVISEKKNGSFLPPIFITDFRYVPMAHRIAPWLTTIEIKRGKTFPETIKNILSKSKITPAKIGFESSIPAKRYLQLEKTFKNAKLVDVEEYVLSLRSVKTIDEIMRIAKAESLNDEIWARAKKEFRYGMTEKEMQRIIRSLMNEFGDGEAFETIVCAGANAAECHHVPDDTVWKKGEPLLVDMGVKLDGVCSDMTRCIKPKKCEGEYKKVYDIVLKANMAAIEQAKPGMTAGALDKIARDIIISAGYGDMFGHSLGHGVGYEIHEMPTARPNDKTVLLPGMLVTIEPGIYLEGKFGVRIEDLILIRSGGCEVLSHSVKL